MILRYLYLTSLALLTAGLAPLTADAAESANWYVESAKIGAEYGVDDVRDVTIGVRFFSNGGSQTTTCHVKTQGTGQEQCSPATKTWGNNSLSNNPITAAAVQTFTKPSFAQGDVDFDISSDYKANSADFTIDEPGANDFDFSMGSVFVHGVQNNAKFMSIIYNYSRGLNGANRSLKLQYKDKNDVWTNIGLGETPGADTAGRSSKFTSISCEHAAHRLLLGPKQFHLRLCDSANNCTGVKKVKNCDQMIVGYDLESNESPINQCNTVVATIKDGEGNPETFEGDLKIGLQTTMAGTFHDEEFCSSAPITDVTILEGNSTATYYYLPLEEGEHVIEQILPANPKFLFENLQDQSYQTLYVSGSSSSSSSESSESSESSSSSSESSESSEGS